MAGIPSVVQHASEQAAYPGAVRADPGAHRLARAAHLRVHARQVPPFCSRRGDTPVLC
jgi:hypothetical protein